MRLLLPLLLLSGLVQESAGQVILEALNGTTWSSQLTLSQPTMTFRWKWASATPVSTANWQITYDSPANPSPAVTHYGAVSVPIRSQYSPSFQIPVPSGAPMAFYVRIRTAIGNSAWLPVTAAGREATAPPPPPPAGTTPIRTPALPDFACAVEGRRPSSGYEGGDKSYVIMANGSWHKLKGKLPPSFSIVVTVTNLGQKAALTHLKVTSWVDGAIDINQSAAVTIEPGMSQTVSLPSTGKGAWDLLYRNDVTARVVVDATKTVEEKNETNNVCTLQFGMSIT